MVEIKDKEGSIVGKLKEGKEEYFTIETETIWGKKSYKICFTYKRNLTSRKKDYSKPSGIILTRNTEEYPNK